MREYRATATINATPEAIWQVLMDVPAYPEWDPYCDRIDGQVTLGGRLKVFSKLSPGRAFPVKVTDLDKPRRMAWTGGMPFGLFTGRRTFSLAAQDGGATGFVLHEVFTGPMLKLIGGSLPDMSEAFAAFAAGLKRRAEAAA